MVGPKEAAQGPVVCSRLYTLRQQLAETALALAATEEYVARVREDMAKQFPQNAARYLRDAESARAEAARAQRFARSLGG